MPPRKRQTRLSKKAQAQAQAATAAAAAEKAAQEEEAVAVQVESAAAAVEEKVAETVEQVKETAQNVVDGAKEFVEEMTSTKEVEIGTDGGVEQRPEGEESVVEERREGQESVVEERREERVDEQDGDEQPMDRGTSSEPPNDALTNTNGNAGGNENEKTLTMEERKKKLDELRKRMREATRENRTALLTESTKSKATIREAARREKQLRLAENLRLRAEAEERGEDAERSKNWEWTIEENEEWERKKRRKERNADFEFHDEEQQARKRYKKDLAFLKPDLETYNKQKQLALGSGAAASSSSSVSNALTTFDPSGGAVRVLFLFLFPAFLPLFCFFSVGCYSFRPSSLVTTRFSCSPFRSFRVFSLLPSFRPPASSHSTNDFRSVTHYAPSSSTSTSNSIITSYEQQRAAESLYRDANTLLYADNKPSEEAIDRVVEKLNLEQDKRNKFSRKRLNEDEGDITYINERNRVFNKKIARYYDKYTAEIRASFERGTAL
ncbi:SYF2-domain-containing protein [Sanghuangporus baumii]|uniref:Pre-mRNA-splicing factor SYF2 n=1 Tax=Sanghuangporus baumii TaxID=108892 RepID=A0A9Q5N6I2_SANBA|nr:SYF2-domain-containing protein [Sanghuangporus baumii]